MTATLESVFRHYKDRLAVLEWSADDQEDTRTYHELHANALKIGAGLRSLYSLSRNDRVIVLSSNGIDFLEMLLACSLFGFVPVFIDFSEYTIDEVREAFIYSSEFEDFKRKQTGIQRLSALTEGLAAFSDSENDTEDTEYDEETGRRLPSRREREEKERREAEEEGRTPPASGSDEGGEKQEKQDKEKDVKDNDKEKGNKKQKDKGKKVNSALIEVPPEPEDDMPLRAHGPKKTDHEEWRDTIQRDTFLTRLPGGADTKFGRQMRKLLEGWEVLRLRDEAAPALNPQMQRLAAMVLEQATADLKNMKKNMQAAAVQRALHNANAVDEKKKALMSEKKMNYGKSVKASMVGGTRGGNLKKRSPRGGRSPKSGNNDPDLDDPEERIAREQAERDAAETARLEAIAAARDPDRMLDSWFRRLRPQGGQLQKASWADQRRDMFLAARAEKNRPPIAIYQGVPGAKELFGGRAKPEVEDGGSGVGSTTDGVSGEDGASSSSAVASTAEGESGATSTAAEDEVADPDGTGGSAAGPKKKRSSQDQFPPEGRSRSHATPSQNTLMEDRTDRLAQYNKTPSPKSDRKQKGKDDKDAQDGKDDKRPDDASEGSKKRRKGGRKSKKPQHINDAEETELSASAQMVQALIGGSESESSDDNKRGKGDDSGDEDKEPGFDEDPSDFETRMAHKRAAKDRRFPHLWRVEWQKDRDRRAKLLSFVEKIVEQTEPKLIFFPKSPGAVLTRAKEGKAGRGGNGVVGRAKSFPMPKKTATASASAVTFARSDTIAPDDDEGGPAGSGLRGRRALHTAASGGALQRTSTLTGGDAGGPPAVAARGERILTFASVAEDIDNGPSASARASAAAAAAAEQTGNEDDGADRDEDDDDHINDGDAEEADQGSEAAGGGSEAEKSSSPGASARKNEDEPGEQPPDEVYVGQKGLQCVPVCTSTEHLREHGRILTFQPSCVPIEPEAAWFLHYEVRASAKSLCRPLVRSFESVFAILQPHVRALRLHKTVEDLESRARTEELREQLDHEDASEFAARTPTAHSDSRTDVPEHYTRHSLHPSRIATNTVSSYYPNEGCNPKHNREKNRRGASHARTLLFPPFEAFSTLFYMLTTLWAGGCCVCSEYAAITEPLVVKQKIINRQFLPRTKPTFTAMVPTKLRWIESWSFDLVILLVVNAQLLRGTYRRMLRKQHHQVIEAYYTPECGLIAWRVWPKELTADEEDGEIEKMESADTITNAEEMDVEDEFEAEGEGKEAVAAADAGTSKVGNKWIKGRGTKLRTKLHAALAISKQAATEVDLQEAELARQDAAKQSSSPNKRSPPPLTLEQLTWKKRKREYRALLDLKHEARCIGAGDHRDLVNGTLVCVTPVKIDPLTKELFVKAESNFCGYYFDANMLKAVLAAGRERDALRKGLHTDAFLYHELAGGARALSPRLGWRDRMRYVKGVGMRAARRFDKFIGGAEEWTTLPPVRHLDDIKPIEDAYDGRRSSAAGEGGRRTNSSREFVFKDWEYDAEEDEDDTWRTLNDQTARTAGIDRSRGVPKEWEIERLRRNWSVEDALGTGSGKKVLKETNAKRSSSSAAATSSSPGKRREKTQRKIVKVLGAGPHSLAFRASMWSRSEKSHVIAEDGVLEIDERVRKPDFDMEAAADGDENQLAAVDKKQNDEHRPAPEDRPKNTPVSPLLQSPNYRIRNLADMSAHNYAEYQPSDFEVFEAFRLKAAAKCQGFQDDFQARRFDKIELRDLCPAKLKFTPWDRKLQNVDKREQQRLKTLRNQFKISTILDVDSDDEETDGEGGAAAGNKIGGPVDLNQIVGNKKAAAGGRGGTPNSPTKANKQGRGGAPSLADQMMNDRKSPGAKKGKKKAGKKKKEKKVKSVATVFDPAYYARRKSAPAKMFEDPLILQRRDASLVTKHIIEMTIKRALETEHRLHPWTFLEGSVRAGEIYIPEIQEPPPSPVDSEDEEEGHGGGKDFVHVLDGDGQTRHRICWDLGGTLKLHGRKKTPKTERSRRSSMDSGTNATRGARPTSSSANNSPSKKTSPGKAVSFAKPLASTSPVARRSSSAAQLEEDQSPDYHRSESDKILLRTADGNAVIDYFRPKALRVHDSVPDSTGTVNDPLPRALSPSSVHRKIAKLTKEGFYPSDSSFLGRAPRVAHAASLHDKAIQDRYYGVYNRAARALADEIHSNLEYKEHFAGAGRSLGGNNSNHVILKSEADMDRRERQSGNVIVHPIGDYHPIVVGKVDDNIASDTRRKNRIEVTGCVLRQFIDEKSWVCRINEEEPQPLKTHAMLSGVASLETALPSDFAFGRRDRRELEKSVLLGARRNVFVPANTGTMPVAALDLNLPELDRGGARTAARTATYHEVLTKNTVSPRSQFYEALQLTAAEGERDRDAAARAKKAAEARSEESSGASPLKGLLAGLKKTGSTSKGKAASPAKLLLGAGGAASKAGATVASPQSTAKDAGGGIAFPSKAKAVTIVAPPPGDAAAGKAEATPATPTKSSGAALAKDSRSTTEKRNRALVPPTGCSAGYATFATYHSPQKLSVSVSRRQRSCNAVAQGMADCVLKETVLGLTRDEKFDRVNSVKLMQTIVEYPHQPVYLNALTAEQLQWKRLQLYLRQVGAEPTADFLALGRKLCQDMPETSTLRKEVYRMKPVPKEAPRPAPEAIQDQQRTTNEVVVDDTDKQDQPVVNSVAIQHVSSAPITLQLLGNIDRVIYVNGTNFIFYPAEVENFVLSLASKRIPKPDNGSEDPGPPLPAGTPKEKNNHPERGAQSVAGGDETASRASSSSPAKAKEPLYKNRRGIAGRTWKSKLRMMMSLETKSDRAHRLAAERERWRKSLHGLNLVDEFVEDVVVRGFPADDRAERIQCFLVVANDITNEQKLDLAKFVLAETREASKFPRPMLPREVKVRRLRDTRRDPVTGLLIRDSVRDVGMVKNDYKRDLQRGNDIEKAMFQEEADLRFSERSMAERFIYVAATERYEKRQRKIAERERRREHYAKIREEYLEQQRLIRGEIEAHNERETAELGETEDWAAKVERGERVEIPKFLEKKNPDGEAGEEVDGEGAAAPGTGGGGEPATDAAAGESAAPAAGPPVEEA